jgi:FHA domain
MSLGVFRRELKRRNVIRACVLYVVACWGVLQVSDIVGHSLGFDDAFVSRILLEASILGFPIAAIFSWFFEVSASGITRTPPFVERRFLGNITPLEERRREATGLRASGRPEQSYDWILEIESGPLSGQRYGLEGSIVVGRSTECDLTIPVPRISRQHARFTVSDGQLLLEDLNSANGTSVNGAKIRSTVNLDHRDKVEILEVMIRVKENLAHFQALDSTLLHDSTLHKQEKTRENPI